MLKQHVGFCGAPPPWQLGPIVGTDGNNSPDSLGGPTADRSPFDRFFRRAPCSYFGVYYRASAPLEVVGMEWRRHRSGHRDSQVTWQHRAGLTGRHAYGAGRCSSQHLRLSCVAVPAADF